MIGAQAADASAAWMHTAFGALTEALNSQRQQLETYAVQQHAASTAMLQHTQTAITLAQQHLQEAGAATVNCRQTVDHTLDSQSAALRDFDHSFATSMQEEQVTPLSLKLGNDSQHIATQALARQFLASLYSG